MEQIPDSTLRIAHSSDLHIETASEGLEILEAVLKATSGADILILAGDVFENNRVPLHLIDAVARRLNDAIIPIVILPGNHDCLGSQSVYVRGGLGDPENVFILGVDDKEHIDFAELDLSVWGRAHRDYADMVPLAGPPQRSALRHIAVAHGHWDQGPEDHDRSWLIQDEHLASLDADYVALGHWDRPVQARGSHPHAYYSGSPQLARSLNLADINAQGQIKVHRQSLFLAE